MSKRRTVSSVIIWLAILRVFPFFFKKKKKLKRGKKSPKIRKGIKRVEAGCIGSVDKLGYTLDNASRFIILAGGADKLDSPIAEAHLFYFIYLWHDQGSTIAVIFAVCSLGGCPDL